MRGVEPELRGPAGLLALVVLSLLAAVGCYPEESSGDGGKPRGRGEGARAAAPPPNVVLVTLDTTRADRLGAYGSAAGLTPHLDDLASRSVVFEQAMAQAAVTPVSHASIFTGLYPYHHGLRVLHGRHRNSLEDPYVTLAEVFSAHGYATAAFVSAFPAGSHFGLAQGFQVFDEDFLQDPGSTTVSPGGTVNTGRVQRRADATTDRAVAWLAEAPEPYFLWVHYFDPHDPLVVPPESFGGGLPRPTGNEREWLKEVYDHEVAFMDAEIGRLLEEVETRDRERTAVVVTADHGEGLGDHDWWTHGILYSEQIHVPLLVRLPAGGDEGPGRGGGALFVEPLVRSIDLAPTLFDLVGVPRGRRPTVDGRSLLPLIEAAAGGGPSTERRTAYADSINTLTYSFTPTIRDTKDDLLFALVDPPWKYIHHLRKWRESELYHLEDDPGETTNLFMVHPDVVLSFQKELQSRDVLPRDPAEDPMDPKERERLEALGYIG